MHKKGPNIMHYMTLKTYQAVKQIIMLTELLKFIFHHNLCM